jgi:hypothetical protein
MKSIGKIVGVSFLAAGAVALFELTPMTAVYAQDEAPPSPSTMATGL